MFMLHLGVERRGRHSLHIGSSHLVVFLRTANGRPYKLVNVTYGVGCRGRQPLQLICPDKDTEIIIYSIFINQVWMDLAC